MKRDKAYAQDTEKWKIGGQAERPYLFVLFNAPLPVPNGFVFDKLGTFAKSKSRDCLRSVDDRGRAGNDESCFTVATNAIC